MPEAKVPDTLSDWMKDHVKRYLATNGADGHMLTLPSHSKPVPTLLLATTGRRSGQKFLFPLIYGPAGKGYVVIASKGGAPDHPGWYKNLLADPKVEVQVADKKFRATARTVTGAERAKLWTEMAALFPPYDKYKEKAAGREIPVVVLDPTP
ncbi:MAG TPA: nitroreductase family deazaflavin-dependent oxidoreductase [Candidatus Sulfotelmatobacter sp.]|nr:nitroreductase family deazaflavin-dependent oxidoreductase [Candidatus Sulfotelmatobacter sp.]